MMFVHILRIAYKKHDDIYKIIGWVKSFGNVGHNSAFPDALANVLKVMNHTELWDTELTLYSLDLHLWLAARPRNLQF